MGVGDGFVKELGKRKNWVCRWEARQKEERKEEKLITHILWKIRTG